MTKVEAWVAVGSDRGFERQDVDLGPLGPEEVEVEVEHCGVCHSDLSMLHNEWGITGFPAILGHEAVGRVVATGSAAKGLQIGQRVGVGWTAGSCMHCRPCLSGDQHLCGSVVPTIVGHRGGFATRVRAHWAWTIPLPDDLPLLDAGPLLCGGITVFNPLAMHAKPTDRVGILGIGGLGHMGLKFAKAFGCDVTAFTSSERKFDEARSFGAQHVVATRDSAAIKKLAGSLDMLIITANVSLDWEALLGTLGPKGRMHVVGAVLEPIPVQAFPLIMKQGTISASPTGSPVDIATMLEFAARHKVTPTTEHFPMSQINEAFEHLKGGKARYRIVLDADFQTAS